MKKLVNGVMRHLGELVLLAGARRRVGGMRADLSARRTDRRGRAGHGRGGAVYLGRW